MRIPEKREPWVGLALLLEPKNFVGGLELHLAQTAAKTISHPPHPGLWCG